ncbi:hypothetical protein BH10CYA1_BH10CYA1_42040 [soil metagenome]
MTTNTALLEDQTEQLKHNLIEAAGKLRAHQLDWIRSAACFLQEIAALETYKKQAEAALEDAELKLAVTDAAFTATRLKVLRLIREKRHYSMISVDLDQNHGNPRNDLWRICATGSDEEVIAAALKLGQHDLLIWENRQLLNAADAALSAAREEMSVVSITRRAAVQQRGKARANIQTALDQLHKAHCEQRVETSGAFFYLESNVVSAAAALSGTGDKLFAYSFAPTNELGIIAPGLELPGGNKMTP